MESNPYRKAIEVLAERGHAKHELEEDDGTVCALGALSCALTGSARGAVYTELASSSQPGPHHGYVVPLADVILEQFPDRVLEGLASHRPTFQPAVVANFNDHPLTTVDEVVLVLEKAAVRQDELV